eukprot:CAMPEP_0196651602 /NCGR_PEP_ID=MMETSP1086-20130531/631_1 /TAXON_ID=77921 /ORGANISM="Cyanoptyche  gloeocystis , Strain SAG4.97" /LENGTH=182 /DNA_ID=CAMNT_0041981693 /DNA_START=205 /DNA_END=753 /DNA_ORIENTATION=+
MREAGLDFTVVTPDIDEKAIRDNDPTVLTRMISRAKALAVMSRLEDSRALTPEEDVVLITSDQVVVCDGQIREKPETPEQARSYLASYSMHPAQTVTSVCVVNVRTAKFFEGTDIAIQHFRPIPDDVIDALIAKGDIFNCSGSFAVEDPLLEPYVGEREGSIQSIRGLPIHLVKTLLSQATD